MAVYVKTSLRCNRMWCSLMTVKLILCRDRRAAEEWSTAPAATMDADGRSGSGQLGAGPPTSRPEPAMGWRLSHSCSCGHTGRERSLPSTPCPSCFLPPSSKGLLVSLMDRQLILVILKRILEPLVAKLDNPMSSSSLNSTGSGTDKSGRCLPLNLFHCLVNCKLAGWQEVLDLLQLLVLVGTFNPMSQADR